MTEPEFTVLTVSARRLAAVPTLDFDVHVVAPGEIYTLALTVGITIEPARRSYAAVSPALERLFGARERWGTTTRSLAWVQTTAVVGTFTGATTFRVSVPCSYDLEQTAPSYFSALAEGEVPLVFHFNGSIFYRGEAGLQITLVPWSCSVDFALPVAVWREAMEDLDPWISLRAETIEALRAEQLRRGSPTLDACLGELLCSTD